MVRKLRNNINIGHVPWEEPGYANDMQMSGSDRLLPS